MPNITVKLGGSLRFYAVDPKEGIENFFLPDGSKISEALLKLGIPTGQARIVLHNGHSASLDELLAEGDRIALFPPELAFNLYVALCLGRREGDENSHT